MPAKSVPQRTVNRYYLLSSIALAVTAVLLLPVGDNSWNLVAYLTAALTLVLGFAGLKRKTPRFSLARARLIVQGTSFIYIILGIVMLWVLLAQLSVAPKLPGLSDLDFENYLRGWPVIEVVLIGSVLNVVFNLAKPLWLAYLSGTLMGVSVLIWLLAAHYGLAIIL